MLTSAGERKIIKAVSLPKQMLNNKVLLQVSDNLNDGCEYETESGLKIILAGGEMEESTRVIRFGKVARVPDYLITKSKSYPMGIEWETSVEIKEGDIVYFGVMASANAEQIEIGDLTYFIIDYSELIMRVRNGVITPINGFCIVQKILEDKITSENLIVNFQKDVLDKRRGVVKYAGAKNKKYLLGSNIDAEVEVGDER